MNGNQLNKAQYPKNTWELIRYIAKKIPERLLKALPMTIAFGAGSWLLHTFLLVYVNEGFNPDTWLGRNILNVKGSLISSTLLWTMIGAIIPMLISFFKKGGNPVNSITSIAKMPMDIIKTNKSTGGRFLPYICFSCAAALFIDGILTGVSSMVAGGIIMSSVVAFITGRGSIFIQILRMITQDIQMFIFKKQRFRLDNNSILMIIGVSGTILLVFGLLKALPKPWFITIVLSYIWIAAVILGIVLLFNNKRVPKQFIFLLGFAGTAWLLSDSMVFKVLADDGGWKEAGGTLGSWITSAGAIPATLSGLPPAIGGLIGSYVATITGGLFEGLGSVIGGDISVPDAVAVPDAAATPVNPVTQPQTDLPAQSDPPADPKEQERILQEQERIQQEFERLRQIKIQEQLEIKNKALEELKKIQEEKRKRQEYINMLCKKYNTTPDKLKRVIKQNMINASAEEAAAWNEYDSTLAKGEAAAQMTLVAADTAIDGLANITGPAGKKVRAGYKVIKGMATGASEAYASGDSMTKGAISGLVKGGADAASDYISNEKYKAGLSVGAEIIGGAITEGGEGAVKGLKNGIYNVAVGTITDRLGGGGYGNDVSLVTQAGGKTAVIITASGGQTLTRIVSTNTAHNLVKSKLINQGYQSGVKGASGLLNEMVVKPALTDYGILPK